MKGTVLTLILMIQVIFCSAQDSTRKATEATLSIGTFNTLNSKNKISINPAISGSIGSYYFENRYNYEAPNSASLNIGKQVLQKSEHFSLVPMIGLVVGDFKALTLELQSGFDNAKWYLSTDNQFSSNYEEASRSLYLNWSILKYKIGSRLQVGLTSVITQQINQHLIFDKGLTASLQIGPWSFRGYMYNFEKEDRYFWLSVRYNIRFTINRNN